MSPRYFSSYALSHFYLPSPVHSKFINAEVVKRYLPVGGVRIEDDILITSNGYENLTTAPKGEAMLQIIRDGKSQDRSTTRIRPSPRSRRTDTVSPLLRAPGIPPQMSKSSMISIPRASTMPAEYMKRNSIDFESYNGPSLCSNFRLSMTTEEKIKHWKDSCRAIRPEKRAAVANRLDPVCGDSSSNSKHIYIGDASCFGLGDDQAPPCKSCAILVQTLDRLRKNLNASAPGSPNLEQIAASEPTTPKSSPAAELKSHAAAESKSPEDWYRASNSQQSRENTQHTINTTNVYKSPGARAVYGSLQKPGTGMFQAPRATQQQLIELAAERYQRLNHIEGVTRQVSGLKLTPRATEQALGISPRAYCGKFKVSP
jgi:Xaa-Pro dipeptidase